VFGKYVYSISEYTFVLVWVSVKERKVLAKEGFGNMAPRSNKSNFCCKMQNIFQVLPSYGNRGNLNLSVCINRTVNAQHPVHFNTLTQGLAIGALFNYGFASHSQLELLVCMRLQTNMAGILDKLMGKVQFVFVAISVPLMEGKFTAIRNQLCFIAVTSYKRQSCGAQKQKTSCPSSTILEIHECN